MPLSYLDLKTIVESKVILNVRDDQINGASIDLTLELKNWTEFHRLQLRPDMKVGQAMLHRITPVPADKSYRLTGSCNDTAHGPVVRA